MSLNPEGKEKKIIKEGKPINGFGKEAVLFLTLKSSIVISYGSPVEVEIG